MKREILCLGMVLLMTTTAQAAETVKDFKGATPQPLGVTAESVAQFKIKFPGTIDKSKLGQKEAFSVTCTPAVEGYSAWADNDSVWTYSFRAKGEYYSAKLAGGSKCQVKQTEALVAADGASWAPGTIDYSVTISGPNVESVHAAQGFNGDLRDKEPVVLLVFDGPVDRALFFAEQSGYLSYTSSNAPGEKIPLAAVPADQAEKLFSYFTRDRYFETSFEDTNWILATVQQNLIPGSQVSLTVQNQASGADQSVRARKKFTKDFSVRSQFQAEVQCAQPSAKNATCLPRSPITVNLNGHAKWMDIKESYIEYVPYKSTDGKLVKSYPELNQEVSLWESFLNTLANYFPFLAKYSDTIVDSIVFNVNIEPETQAKVVLPANLQDIEGRALSNTLAEFHIRIGTMGEVIHVPQSVSFFEKNVPNLYLPVGIVNLNQKIAIRKTGTDAKVWESIRDVPAMIEIIRGYEARKNYRTTANYTSPLETLGVKTTMVEEQLTGAKNRPNFLQFPFGEAGKTPQSGLYALEVSSPTYEAGRSNADDGEFYNPKYVLAQVTDLAVHMKRGEKSTLVWVTRLSEALPVAGADVEIYNCLGQQVKTLKTDASGLVRFANQNWADDCKGPEDVYSEYFSKENFFVVARTADDVSLSHTTWQSKNSYAMAAPGIDWYYNDISEGRTYYHAVIGVNLVKPGQQVPIELIAKMPQAKGLADVATTELPATARISNLDENDIYFDLPLTWKGGIANIVWNVPGESAAKLGRYIITLKNKNGDIIEAVSSGDIDVAEFKVPLMSGLIAFPTKPLVRPDSIPVSAVIRYANGVGAKDLPVDLSYYFEPTSIRNKIFTEFSFGSGPVKINEDDSKAVTEALPKANRPATLQGLSTGDDGSFSKDLALEKASDGRSVAEVLKTLDRPQKLVVRVRYQDQMGEYQTLSQAKDILNSSEYVGTQLVSGSRNDALLRAAVIDASQKNITDLKNLEIKVIRVETKVIGEELFGGLIKNTLERELKQVRWNEACATQKNVVNCRVGALKAGNYAFQVTSKTSKQAGHTLFKVDADGRVYGAADFYHFGDDEGSKYLPLALNKKSYKDGERAVVSFPAPFKTCRALVTLERNDVIEASVVSNACDKGFVEIPVNANLAPNAFVSVYAITGRATTAAMKLGEMDLGRPTYRLGFANMKVNWSRFKSKVEVKTNKEKYEPGEVVEVQVKVNPEEGNLQGGTVTLVAIEEKILELKENSTYKLLESLMQLRRHDVVTVTPLERVETVTVGNADLPADADSRKGGDEGGGGGEEAESTELQRRLFNALVSFQPGVPVVNGVAKFSFKANDSLTRFKVFAIANDSAQKFGTGEAVYLTEKDTQTYSNIPSVAHSGDKYPVKVTIQNNKSKEAGYKTVVEVVVKDSKGQVIDRKTMTKESTVKASGSQAVDLGDFTVNDDAASIEYVVRVYDANGNLVDVMSPEAQTVLPSVPLAIHNSYIVQVENGAYVQELTKEATALSGKGEIRVAVSNSLVNGAVKQVQSRITRDAFADIFIESRFNKALLNSSEAKPEELKQVLESLLASTDYEGFVKYYPQAPKGSLWLTASILTSLEQEPWALKLVPAALAAKLKGAVSQVLTKSVNPIYVGKNPIDWMRAQAVMGRAAFAFQDASLHSAAKAISAEISAQLKKNPTFYGAPVEKWSNSDLLNVWLLEVYTSPKTAAGSSMYAQLVGPRLVYAGNTAQLMGKPSYGFFYTDETKETADLLLGHSRLQGDSKLARSLAVGLVNLNKEGWYNTSTMMSVAQGLKVFGRAYEAAAVTGSSVVTIPEQQVNSTVDWSKSATSEVVSPWTQNKATVQVAHAGQGGPWVGVQGLTAVPLTAPRGQGISIDKEVRNLNRASGYQAGDIVEVTLKIQSASSMNNVAMLDPIPAGANIVNEAYGAYSSGQKSYSGYKFYFANLSTGMTVVKYQYQLNNPGSFKLPPTRAEALYTPSVFGETPNETLTVK